MQSLALAPSVGLSHHSFAAEFIREVITIEGIVTEVWFKNPHVRYYMEVTNERGETEVWDTRGGSATNLQRSGAWTRDSIKPGDWVVMTGNRGRDGRKLLDIRMVRLPDGTVLPPDAAEEYRHTD
jgi:hypothetical protein